MDDSVLVRVVQVSTSKPQSLWCKILIMDPSVHGRKWLQVSMHHVRAARWSCAV